MDTHRHLSIGVTVNLEHYENLRLEVSGELNTPSEADELVAFLDQVLSTLGRGDAATAERVDSYRRRVFSCPLSAGEKLDLPSVVPKKKADIPEKQETQASAGDSPLARMSGPACPASRPSEVLRMDHEPKNESAMQLPSETIESTVLNVGEGGNETCEACGSPVSGSEKKISELFASRILCKKCIRRG